MKHDAEGPPARMKHEILSHLPGKLAYSARMKHEGASETRRALPGLTKQFGKGKTGWFHAAD